MSYVSIVSHLSEDAPVDVRPSAANNGEALVVMGGVGLNIMISMPPSELLNWVNGFRFVDMQGTEKDFYVLPEGNASVHVPDYVYLRLEKAIYHYLGE